MAPRLPSTEPARSSTPRKRKPSAKLEHPKKTWSAKKKTSTRARAPRKKARTGEDDVCADEHDEEQLALAEEEELAEQRQGAVARPPARRKRRVARPSRARAGGDQEHEFVGEPVPRDEALKAWPTRYQQRRSPPRRGAPDDEEEEEVKARAHYRRAKIDDTIYCLNDDV